MGDRPRKSSGRGGNRGFSSVLDAPCGRLAVGRREGLLVAEWLEEGRSPPTCDRQDGAALELLAALRAYLDGDLRAPETVPVGDGTPFQRRVWNACRRIPPGETRTYLWIARQVGGGHSGCRAVGQALRRNPLPVAVPCHRVTSTAGLGGYAGSREGDLMQIKTWLLQHEARLTDRLLECAPSRDPGGTRRNP
jgi:methylated-DNA-[protein]-cysteine S-methyltransferase